MEVAVTVLLEIVISEQLPLIPAFEAKPLPIPAPEVELAVTETPEITILETNDSFMPLPIPAP